MFTLVSFTNPMHYM